MPKRVRLTDAHLVLTSREYDGLRIYQRLFFPYTVEPAVTIDLATMANEHPEWLISLQYAFDWLSRVLFEANKRGLSKSRRTYLGTKLRLSPESIEEMRALRKQGYTFAQIAKHTGISPTTAQRETFDIKVSLPSRRRSRARRGG